jgi:o-succinylbenzoate synthase
MIIQKSQSIPYQIPLTRTWITRQGSLEQRSGWLIKLEAGNYQGIGDCAPLASTGTETLTVANTWLKQHLHLLTGKDVEGLLESLDSLKPPPATRCGIETALIDMLAKQQGLSIAQWLNTDASNNIKVNANLGRLHETTAQSLDDASGYPVIKLKVGMAPVEEELVWLQELTEVLPADVSLRLDANQAWSYGQASKFISALASLPIESIEEPLANPDDEQLRRLQQETDIPLALDESLIKLDLTELWQRPPVKRITLKPMVMGGLLPSLRMAQQAHEAEIDVIVTTTIDSAVGVWAATHLAAALGKKGEGLAHGLATSQWLVSNVAEPPPIQHGTITLDYE